MKILSITIFSCPNKIAKLLSSAQDLTTFGYFQRGSVKEFLIFFSKTVIEKTELNQRQSVQQEEYFCHVHLQAKGLGGVVVCDAEYPRRVAFTLLNKVLDEFAVKYDKNVWASSGELPFAQLDEYIKKYQDPVQADPLMRVQSDLDETKIILHKTIESVLDRGDKLDTLIERSDDLSKSSKMFYTTAKKQNACCVVQ